MSKAWDKESDGQQTPVIQVERRSVGIGTFVGALVLMGMVSYIAGTRSNLITAFLRGTAMSTDSLDLSAVEDTYRTLKANYDGTIDTQKLIDGASRGLTAAAGDRYTVFMDKTEAGTFNQELSGEVTGIGAEIGVRASQPTIIRVITGSPAEKAGVKAGDIIQSVNDESIQGQTTDQVATKIRGTAGTSVKVSVKRVADAKDFTIVREKLNDPSVRWKVQDGVGLITMTRFDTDTAQLMRDAATQLKAQNVKGIILDLRDNGGGYLDAARDVASLWLRNKVVVTERRGDTVTGTEKTSGEPAFEGVKTILLVNGGSASASEIVAGALQEYGAATLLGEKTFGKGSVQKVVQLDDGRILKVTIAKWYTPKGKNITKEGIAPDTTVPLTAADTDAGKDPQLDAAMQKINQ